MLVAAGPSCASDLTLAVTGNLLGVVAAPSGTPEMGAAVELFDRYHRLIGHTFTSRDGRFAFAGLSSDVYSLRVSLASFVPVLRDKIEVKPGLDSVLRIHMATLFSNAELSYVTPSAAMTDDWKWVLRSSAATRPITRFLPGSDEGAKSASVHPRVFSDTHAMLTVSGGDGGFVDNDTVQSDVGTGFALSTSFFGKNQLQFGGIFSQDPSFGPSAMSLAAVYSRTGDGPLGAPPEVTLTISQIGRMGPMSPVGTVLGTNNGPDAAAAVLRSMSLSIYQTADPIDGVHFEYGMTGESVDYLQQTSRVTPFARLTVDTGSGGQVVAAVSDGSRPDELLTHQSPQSAELDGPSYDDLLNTVSTLGRLPQVSLRAGALQLQRTRNYEVGYRNTQGNRTYAISAFHEEVSNGRIDVAGDVTDLAPADLLSDGISTTSTYNIGNYHRNGYVASLSQQVNDSLDIAVAYGRVGGFTVNPDELNDSWGVQQKFLDRKNRNLASVNLKARAPVTGTQIVASYGWMDQSSLVPLHAFTTQNTYIRPGFNLCVRQPLPSFGLPGHFELTADLRNLLAQGYVPLNSGNGHGLLIVQSPRAVRGGLNFIF